MNKIRIILNSFMDLFRRENKSQIKHLSSDEEYDGWLGI